MNAITRNKLQTLIDKWKQDARYKSDMTSGMPIETKRHLDGIALQYMRCAQELEQTVMEIIAEEYGTK